MTLKDDELHSLKDLIEIKVFTEEPQTDLEKLTMLVIRNLHERLYNKSYGFRQAHRVKFKAEEAMALKIWFQPYPIDYSSYTGNLLRRFIETVDQHFA